MRINILITIIVFLLAGCGAKMGVKETAVGRRDRKSSQKLNKKISKLVKEKFLSS